MDWKAGLASSPVSHIAADLDRVIPGAFEGEESSLDLQSGSSDLLQGSLAAMQIIDPHVHFWDPHTTPRSASAMARLGRWPRLQQQLIRVAVPAASRAFVGHAEHVVSPHLPEHHLVNSGRHDIAGVVHVQAGWEEPGPLGPVGETRWLQRLAHPPLGIVAHANLEDPGLGDLLQAHQNASPGFVGVRDMLSHSGLPGVMSFSEQPHRMGQSEFIRGYELLGSRGLSFDAWVYDHQLAELCELVERHPDTAVMLDHLGSPVGLGGPFQGRGRTRDERRSIQARWEENLQRLAESPQVRVKLSGLLMPVLGWGFHQRPERAGASEVVDKIGPLIRFALDTFGAERCLFASNFPMDSVSVTLEALYDAFFEISEPLGELAQRRLFRDNAVAFYRLELGTY